MTTLSIVSLFIVAMLIYALVNVILWLLEVIGAFIRVLVSYFLQRPHSFKKAYLSIRIIFTGILLKMSFALLSPKKIVRLKRYQYNWHHKSDKKGE